MKNFILLTILAFVLAVMFVIGFDRSWDNRCEAYANPDIYPHPTDKMKSLCPDLDID
jgi:hypothetical protein